MNINTPKILLKKISLTIIATSILSIIPAYAGDYIMGNYDIKGSRAIPDKAEKQLTKENISKHGLEIKWFTQTDTPVQGVPVVYKGVVYVGSSDIGGNGSIYALNGNTGAVLWTRVVPGGVLASPYIEKGKLYIATLNGTLIKLDRTTGGVIWQTRPGISDYDSVWSGPIHVGNGNKKLIIMTINPNDEFPGIPNPGGQGAVIAIDENTGQEVWRTVVTAPNEGGSGIWNVTPSYSKKLNQIFVSTGQTSHTTQTTSASSDSVFALNAKTGQIIWKTQMKNNDIWSFSDPFNPVDPKDTDIGDGPALFSINNKEYLSVGSKRGYFYVLEAKTGKVVNGSGVDSLGFVKGLDAFNYSGSGVVGNALDGGYNLDSGYYQDKKKTIHFGILSDYKQNLTTLLLTSPVCYIAGFGVGEPTCPLINTGNLILIDENGKKELGRYVQQTAHLFSPLYLNGMVFVTTTSNESTGGGGVTNPNSVLVIDVKNPNNPKKLLEVPLTYNGISAISGGAMLSIGNDMIYVGNGFFGFGAQQGIFGIGLKGK